MRSSLPRGLSLRGRSAKLGFVSLDERLADAAQREGFQVVPQQQV